MVQPRYLREYADLFAKIGAVAFQVRFRSPVLVGLGMVGRISDHRKRRDRSTLHSDALREVALIQSVFDRVWHLRKSPVTPCRTHITLGRVVDNDLVLPEYTISAFHCAFSYQRYRLLAQDLRSLNGTRIDGALLDPFEPTPIHDQSSLTVGRVKFRFLTGPSFVSLVRQEAVLAA